MSNCEPGCVCCHKHSFQHSISKKIYRGTMRSFELFLTRKGNRVSLPLLTKLVESKIDSYLEWKLLENG